MEAIIVEKLIRFWNQNRKDIIKIIAIVAFILIIIVTVNTLLENNRSDNQEIDKNENREPNQSVITGIEVPTETTQENVNIIQQFVDYCNNKDTENAYNLLSSSCKEEFNNDINVFIQNYYNQIFQTPKTYSMELWLNNASSYTYQVKFFEDNLLATGGTSINSNIEDYITVVNENGENKINVNGLISSQSMNKTASNSNVEITIHSRTIYKNYESYNISIKNNTQNNVIISDGSNSNDITLLDENNIAYGSFINEIPINLLSLKPRQQINIDIGFNKIYDTYRKIEQMQFTNLNIENQGIITITIDI